MTHSAEETEGAPRSTTGSIGAASQERSTGSVPTAVRSLGLVEPTSYRRWITNGILIALLGYAGVTLAGLLLGGTDSYTVLTQVAAFLVCAAALASALRGKLELGAGVALAAVWFELQAGLHRTGMDAPGLTVLPAVVVASGFLYGGRGAFAVATATALSVGILALGVHPSSTDSAPNPATEIYAFLVLVTSLFVVAALIYVAMRALSSATLRAVEARGLEEAREADVRRLEGIARLAGGIAHQFNNHLTVIGVSAELLLEAANPETRETAANVLEAQSRASLLTAELVAFAEREVVVPKRVCLTEVLELARPTLATLAGGRTSLILDLRPTPEVVTDPRQVARVAATLVAHARDVQRGTGSIEVSLLGPNDRKEVVAGDETVPARCVELRVEDHGPGLGEDGLEWLREPFPPSVEFGSRSSLGLAALHGIATRDGGGVLLDSREGVGTCVRVRWPLPPAD